MSSKLSEDARSRLMDQLVKLGDMMGDGLHHEEPWISKEYEKVSRALFPEEYAELRRNQNKARDEKMQQLLESFQCTNGNPACGGSLKQTRSGSKTAVCTSCGTHYRAKKAKSKK